jgi:transcriptional regulator with XRE-family HTH domain
MTIGARIRELREQQSLSGAELARRVGCSKGYLSTLERDGHDPALGMLARIARGLGLTVVGLLAGVEVENALNEPIAFDQIKEQA